MDKLNIDVSIWYSPKNNHMYGLIGKSLVHSFSPAYFQEKFSKLNLEEKYLPFPLNDLSELERLLQSFPELKGFNVTNPYKEAILPYLDELDYLSREVGSVNCVKIQDGKRKGYNTDVLGFEQSLAPIIKQRAHQYALVLGTGGASKAITFVLKKNNLETAIVSRTKGLSDFIYSDLSEELIKQFTLIINATPLGTWPDLTSYPDIPYNYLSEHHFCYDLIYNPEQTTFLQKAQLNGAQTKNGMEMLILQAEASWAIWNNKIY